MQNSSVKEVWHIPTLIPPTVSLYESHDTTNPRLPRLYGQDPTHRAYGKCATTTIIFSGAWSLSNHPPAYDTVLRTIEGLHDNHTIIITSKNLQNWGSTSFPSWLCSLVHATNGVSRQHMIPCHRVCNASSTLPLPFLLAKMPHARPITLRFLKGW